jgi:ceramide glucosyltransferase
LRFLWLIFLPAAVYQCLAIIASLRQALRRPPVPWTDGVSVLKPLRGLDPNTREAFISQIQQTHPQFEVLFGAREEDDPGAREVTRLQPEYSREASFRLLTGGTDAPNGKVGLLIELNRQARYPLRVVNDSDIKVGRNYLAEVTAPLADPRVGVVTCLYRVRAHTFAAGWEALGVMTDFMPSTMVAQLIGVREFGLGSTLAFRGEDLEKAGGFEGFADYLADDYQLAKRITALGKRVVLSTYVVETAIGDATWLSAWNHQLRWARTIRFSKGAGYFGLPITQAGLWALLAWFAGAPQAAVALMCLRVLGALLAGGLVLRSSLAVGWCWLTPVWDLYSFAVWLASYCGKTVRWRDRSLEIGPEGRIGNSRAC